MQIISPTVAQMVRSLSSDRISVLPISAVDTQGVQRGQPSPCSRGSNEKQRSYNTGKFDKIHHRAMVVDLLASDLGKLSFKSLFVSLAACSGTSLGWDQTKAEDVCKSTWRS